MGGTDRYVYAKNVVMGGTDRCVYDKNVASWETQTGVFTLRM